MRKTLSNKALIFLAAMSLSMMACQKAKLNGETTTSADLTRTQYIWNDIIRQATGGLNIAVVDTNLRWNKCATVSRDTLGDPYPLSFTLDFGLSNCIDFDGRQRKGRLICELNKNWLQTGSVLTIVSDGYHINNLEVAGSAVVTSLGANDGGFPVFETVIRDVTISSSIAPTITWEAIQSRVQVAGSETSFFSLVDASGVIYGADAQQDDIFSISEISSGINSDGRSYDAESTKDLRFDLKCRYVTGGTVEVRPEFLKMRTVDFGDLHCDDIATVKIEDKEIALDIEG